MQILNVLKQETYKYKTLSFPELLMVKNDKICFYGPPLSLLFSWTVTSEARVGVSDYLDKNDDLYLHLFDIVYKCSVSLRYSVSSSLILPEVPTSTCRSSGQPFNGPLHQTASTSDVTVQLNSRETGGAPDKKNPDLYYFAIWILYIK